MYIGVKSMRCDSPRFVKRKKNFFVEMGIFCRYPQNICFVLTGKRNPQNHGVSLWIMWITGCITLKTLKNNNFPVWITFVDNVDNYIVFC